MSSTPDFTASRLDAYRLALSTQLQVEAVSAHFPKGYANLRSQLRRSALSVVLNIAEGSGRKERREKASFYRIARGESVEMRAALHIARELDLVDEAEFDAIWKRADRVGAMLYRLVRQWSD